MNTSVSQEENIVSQESSSFDQEMEVPWPTKFPAIYKSSMACVTYVYAIYWRAQDGLDSEW